MLVLLYADRRGDLRVVLTMRAATLRSFSGALVPVIPGGRRPQAECWMKIRGFQDGHGSLLTSFPFALGDVMSRTRRVSWRQGRFS